MSGKNLYKGLTPEQWQDYGAAGGRVNDNNVLLPGQALNGYKGPLGLGGNAALLTPEELAIDQASYTTDLPSWTTKGLYGDFAKMLGTDSESLTSLGSGLGGLGSLAKLGFDWNNQNKTFGLAEDQWDFQKGVMEDQIAEAKADKAKFTADRAAATKHYYNA